MLKNIKQNKILYYSILGTGVFAVIFLVLNFPDFYAQNAPQITRGEIIYDNPKQSVFLNFRDKLPAQENIEKINYHPGPNSISISKINIKAPLIQATGSTQTELNSSLNQGVILYPGSALPGENGEVFLSGHSSTYIWNKTPYGQVFASLNHLEAGDIVSLFYNNYQYDYRIIGKEILLPNQVKISGGSEPRLTLMTCWPVGTSLKRLIVRGELIK